MKFPLSWLDEFVPSATKPEELAHLLTMAGLEVDEHVPVAPPCSGIVVAEVLEVEPHPNADRLRVCTVQTEASPTAAKRQIVCGAANVRANMKVACALPGATLPGGMVINASKLRGVDSAGMLCSAKELCLDDSEAASKQIMDLPSEAPIGSDIRQYLTLDDYIFTLKLTPNRADCLSLIGIAREVGALTGQVTQQPQIAPVAVSSAQQRKILLESPKACPVYYGCVISHINAAAATPVWLRQRLERSGIRCISALVDITNYVMLELGQPLHAFDNSKLKGDICVRYAHAGESLLLLNEQTLEFDSDELLIADASGPIAMAGIMGGEPSGISDKSVDVFLESAFFAPQAIAGRARRHGFVSDASHRFERGVDFAGAERALGRASQLILEICGGEAAPICRAISEKHLPARAPVSLRAQRASRLLGMEFDSKEITRLLKPLELKIEGATDSLRITPPSWRFDLETEEDLIEEVARLHGYDNIPPTAQHTVNGKLGMAAQSEHQFSMMSLRSRLADIGYQEVINLAFVEPDRDSDFSQTRQEDAVMLANPLTSQLSRMRSTLLGGLISNLQTNIRRKQGSVRLFESGRCFQHGKSVDESEPAGYEQPWKLALLAWGSNSPEQWGEATRRVDYYDLKGDLEILLSNTSASEFSCTPSRHPALHPGRSALISQAGNSIGLIGELHPRWVQKYELQQAPVLCELDLQGVLSTPLPRFQAVSAYPPMVRDLAVVVDANLPADSIIAELNAKRPEIVNEINIFDVYSGKGIDQNQKSLAFRIVMQDTRKTLRDEEADAAVADMLAVLQDGFGARLRK